MRGGSGKHGRRAKRYPATSFLSPRLARMASEGSPFIEQVQSPTSRFPPNRQPLIQFTEHQWDTSQLRYNWQINLPPIGYLFF